MPDTERDRLWVASLALGRTTSGFGAADVLEVAGLPDDRRETAVDVLRTMLEYGMLRREDPAAGDSGSSAGHLSSAPSDGGGSRGPSSLADTRGDDDRYRLGPAAPVTDVPVSGFDGSFTYLAAPVSRWTFAPEAVRDWVESHLRGRVLDLFAGGTALDHDGEVVRNSTDPDVHADTRFDAREIGAHLPPDSFDTVLLDPPIAIWRGVGGGSAGSGDVESIKTAAAGLVRPGGRTILFGRSSTGMGRSRGFEPVELCLVNHPGATADTIAVVERRIRDSGVPNGSDGDGPE